MALGRLAKYRWDKSKCCRRNDQAPEQSCHTHPNTALKSNVLCESAIAADQAMVSRENSDNSMPGYLGDAVTHRGNTTCNLCCTAVLARNLTDQGRIGFIGLMREAYH